MWYYKLWVDAITAEQAKKSETLSWKTNTLIPISALMGMNLFTFFYWMKALNHNLPLIFTVNVFNAKPLNGFISFLITLFIPFLILNYLLIFSNNRYEVLLNEYAGQNGKLYKRYVMITLGVLFIPILLQKLFFQPV